METGLCESIVVATVNSSQHVLASVLTDYNNDDSSTALRPFDHLQYDRMAP